MLNLLCIFLFVLIYFNNCVCCFNNHEKYSDHLREDLVVSNIKTIEDFNITFNTTKWVSISDCFKTISVGVFENKIHILELSKNGTNIIYNHTSEDLDYTVENIKLIENTKKSQIILLISSKTSIYWYKLQNLNFEKIWTWNFIHKIHHFDVIKLQSSEKLIVLNNASKIEVYDFTPDLDNFWLSQSINLDTLSFTAAFVQYKWDFYLSVTQKNHVIIYKYKNNHFVHHKNISCEDVDQIVSFGVGFQSFLAFNGREPKILKFEDDELVEQNVLNSHLDHIEYFQVLPITKYRDDTVLLIQRNLKHGSHNSTVIDLLTYNGKNFIEHEDVPCLFFGEDLSNLNCLINGESNHKISQITSVNIDEETYILVPNKNGNNVLFSMNVTLMVLQNPLEEELEELKKEKDEIMKLLHKYENLKKNITSEDFMVSSSLTEEAKNGQTVKKLDNILQDTNEEETFKRIHDDINNIDQEISTLNQIMDDILNHEKTGVFGTVILEGNSVIENGFFAEMISTNIDMENIVFKNNLRHITGQKRIDNLLVNNLNTDFINGVAYSNVQHKTDRNIVLNGNVLFKNEVRTQHLHIQSGLMNNINVDNDVVYMNKNISDAINFKNILVENQFSALEVNNLNIIEAKSKNQFNEETIFLPENATVKNINGENLNDFINEICLRNVKCYIPRSLKITGDLFVHKNSYTENLNDLPYPDGYVFMDESPHLNITGEKIFEKLGVKEIRTSGIINGENTDSFITLLSDQHIQEIEFNELEIAEEINIKGKIIGKHLDKFLSNPVLSNTISSIDANTNFKKIILDGNLIVSNNFNDENFEKTLLDIVYKDELSPEIMGRVDFNEGITIENNLEVQSNMINDININDIVTKDTDQILNIKTLDGSVGFEHVYLKGLFGGQNISQLDFETIKLSGSQFISSKLIFENLEIKNLEITNELNNQHYSDYFYTNSDNIFLNPITFEDSNVETINLHKNIQGDIQNFNVINILNNTLSSTKDQKLSGDFTAQNIKTEDFKASKINGKDYKKYFGEENIYREMLNRVVRRNMMIQNLHIDDSLNVEDINERKASEMLGNGRSLPRNIEFENDVFFNNIEINKLSEVNFTEFINDIVFKTEQKPKITGNINFLQPVKVSKLIEIEKINNIDIDEILTKFGKQKIIRPIVIQGNVHFDEVNIKKSVNNVDVKEVFEKINMSGETLNIKDDVVFERKPTILNLTVHGFVNNVELEEHLKNIVDINNPSEINGDIVFSQKVNIQGDLNVENTLNTKNVQDIISNSVSTVKNENIQGPIVFNDTIFFLNSLVVDKELTTGKLLNFDVDEWKKNAIFVNKGLLKGTYTFENAYIQESILTKFINDIDMDTIVPLRTDQNLPDMFFDEVSVIRELHLKGYLSGYNISNEVLNTLTLDQSHDVSSEIVFQNNILIREKLSTKKINNIDIQNIVTTNTDQNLTAPYHFQMKCTLQNNMFIDGYLNNINLTEWNTNVVKENSDKTQEITQTWDVTGNLTVLENFEGDGLINNMDLHKIQNEIGEKINYKYTVEKAIIDDYNNLCKDIENVYSLSKKQIYKFRYFDFLQEMSFDDDIGYVKHIKHNQNNYLLVNEVGSCTSHILFYGTTFKPISSVETGFIEEIITVSDKNLIYLVTRSPKKTHCNLSGTNVWKFEKGEMEQLVNLNHMTLLQESLVPGTFYGLTKHGVTEFLIKKNIVKPYRKWDIFEENMAFTPRGLATGLSIRTGHNLFFLSRNEPEETENSNDLSMNLDIIILGNVTKKSNRFIPGRVGGHLATTKVGINESERTLLAVATHEDMSVRDPLDFITIYSDAIQGKIFHKISTYKPSSLLSIEFNNGETLLAFLENKRVLQIYEYKGINGFKHRLSAKITASELFLMDLPLPQYFNDRKVIGAVNGNKITLLEAVMTGNQVSEDMSCKL